MRFRLITLFKVMTAIAVITPFAIYAWKHNQTLQGPPLLIWGRFFAVVAPIFGGTFLFLWWGIKGKPNDSWITYGLIIGVVLGVIVGNTTSLGEWAIDHFNPNLPVRDFKTSFGSIVGGLVGAWFGALAGGIASAILRNRLKLDKPANR
jgi:hypothetical protein